MRLHRFLRDDPPRSDTALSHPVLSALLVLGLGMSPLLAAELVGSDVAEAIECGLVPATIGVLPGDIAWEYYTTPECGDHEEALAVRLDEALRDGWTAFGDARMQAQTAQRIRGTVLRHALARRDLDSARALLDVLDADAAHEAESHVARVGLLPPELSEEDKEEITRRVGGRTRVIRTQWARLREIVDGRAPPAPAVVTVSPDWRIYFGWCGTPRVSWEAEVRSTPGVPDAWRARGRADVALQQLLMEQWVHALALGTSPPRLREFATSAFGEGAYEREVRIALDAIRIEEGPDGRTATMPLFGLVLPLPVGIEVWDAERSREFRHPVEVADYMRGVLLDEWR